MNPSSAKSNADRCPGETALLQLLDDGSADQTIERHVNQCQACQSRLDALVLAQEDQRWRAWRDEQGSIHQVVDRSKATFPPSEDALPTLPEIQGYELRREIGRGGTGVVYEAVDRTLGRRVAIKTLLSGFFSGPEQLSRFAREAKTLANLEHPGILQIFGADETAGLPYLLLEYIDGPNLHQWMANRTPSPKSSVFVVRQLAAAVHQAHLNGIIHRDLKPSNVLVLPAQENDEGPIVKVADFGLADFADTAPKTLTGTLMGTPSYMAPEQVTASDSVGPATDIYSLGAILYELLTGRPPFRGAIPAETLRQVANDDPIPPRQSDRTIPRELETICLKCLSRAPSKRYPTAAALDEDLSRWQRGFPIQARPVGRIEKSYRWAARNRAVSFAIATVGLVICGAFAAILFFLAQTQDSNRQLVHTIEKLEANAYLDGVESAWRTWEANDIELAEQILDRLPEHRRHFEWSFLKASCDQATTTIDTGAAVEVLAVSPDGRWVAYSGTELGLQVRDAANRALVHSVRPESPIVSLVFAADGNALFCGDVSGKISAWRCSDWKRDASHHASQFPITALAVHSQVDGVAFATNQGDGGIVATSDGRELHQFPRGRAVKLHFDPTGQTLFAAHPDSAIDQWHLASGRVQRLGNINIDGLTDLALGSANQLYTVGRGTTWFGFDAQLTKQFESRAFTGINRCVLVDSDSKLVTAGPDGTVRLWNAATGEPLSNLRGHRGETLALAWNRHRSEIISGGKDGTLRFWDIVPNGGGLVVRPLGSELGRLDFARTSQNTIAVLMPDRNQVQFWDAELSAPVTTLKLHAGKPLSCKVSPDGRWLAVGFEQAWPLGLGNQLTVYNLDTMKEQGSLRPLGGPVTDMAFDPESRILFCRGNDANVVAWDLAKKSVIAKLGSQSSITRSVDVSKDGEFLAAKTDQSQLRVWRLPTRKRILESTFDGLVITGARFSPDGTRLAVGARDGIVRLLSIPEGNLIRKFADASQIVAYMAFSPDGRRLATGQTDGRIRIWDVESGRRLLSIQVGRLGIRGLLFHPDGRRLYATSRDGMLVMLRGD